MNTSNILDNVRKPELRSKCKRLGIPYGRLTADGMRAAILARTSKRRGPHRVGSNGRLIASGSARGVKSVVRNGVRQPTEGTQCRKVWDTLGTLGGALELSASDARTLAKRRKWNLNNTVIEFYNWRRFHGVSGRQQIH